MSDWSRVIIELMIYGFFPSFIALIFWLRELRLNKKVSLKFKTFL